MDGAKSCDSCPNASTRNVGDNGPPRGNASGRKKLGIDFRFQLKAHLLQHTAKKRIFVIAITSQA
jgi:hypothetical protein